MTDTAKLQVDGKSVELPIIVGSEGEQAIDVSKLRAETGYITLDQGYGNTGSCKSDITFIDGDKGILRYRGYPIEELAEKSSFIETAYLLIWGELPTEEQLQSFSDLLTGHQMLHEGIRRHLDFFSSEIPAHGGAVLCAQRSELFSSSASRYH